MEESRENIPTEEAAPGEGIQAEMENAEGTDPQPAEEVLLLDPPETENGEEADLCITRFSNGGFPACRMRRQRKRRRG